MGHPTNNASFILCFCVVLMWIQLCVFVTTLAANDPDCNLCEEKELPRGNVCFENFSKTGYRPWCPSRVDVQFYLYTRHSRNSAQMIQAYDGSIQESLYAYHKPIKFLIHGFGGEGPQTWSLNLKDALLDEEDINVIIVDWRKGASPGSYLQACANTMSTGVMIGQLIPTMWCFHGHFYQRVHCIGYSLGAHVCGFAGKEVTRVTSSLIGRITGLDAAGPEFESNPVNFRLDKSDAIFVDTLHTDAQPGGGGWGIHKAIGHVDYYVNGGYSQPGCAGRAYCNHRRCKYYFQYSIDNWNYDPALDKYRCIMGYHVNKSCRGEYYPETQTKFPYRPLNITD